MDKRGGYRFPVKLKNDMMEISRLLNLVEDSIEGKTVNNITATKKDIEKANKLIKKWVMVGEA